MLDLLGLEGPAIPWIALVGAVTVVLFASVLLAARRRGIYATVPVALLAAAWAGVALASSVALWMFRGTLDELKRLGGGFATVLFGISQAARVPLASAWIAVAATTIALFFVLRTARNEPQPARSALAPWLPGLAVAAAVGGVLLFRGTITFVIAAMTPGAQPAPPAGMSLGEMVYARIFTAGMGSVLCFLAAMVLLFAAIRRGSASRPVVVAALVVSLVVSAILITNLRRYSNAWRDLEQGRVRIQALLPQPLQR